jgi:hypothetical protein
MRYKSFTIALILALNIHARSINIENIAQPCNVSAVSLGGIRCRFNTYELHQLQFDIYIPYGLNALSKRELSFLGNMHELGINCAIAQEGNADLNTTSIALGMSKRLSSSYYAGIKGTYIQTSSETENPANLLLIEINGVWSIAPTLQAALFILNPNASSLQNKERRHTVSSAAYTGIKYHLNDQSQLYGEVDLLLHQKPRIRFGLQFTPCRELRLKVGIADKPWTPSWGFGIQNKRLSFNYAANCHQVLGLSSGFSVCYNW